MRATARRIHGRRGNRQVRRLLRTARPARPVWAWWACQAGQGMIEYALIGGILIVGAVAVLTALSKSLNDLFSAISSTLAQY